METCKICKSPIKDDLCIKVGCPNYVTQYPPSLDRVKGAMLESLLASMGYALSPENGGNWSVIDEDGDTWMVAYDGADQALSLTKLEESKNPEVVVYDVTIEIRRRR